MPYNIHTEKIYALSDIHGSIMEIAGHIRKYDLRNCALIFCGDIGFGFEKTEYYEQIYQKLRPLLSRNNIYCYFVRGNHDNPALFDGKQIAHKTLHSRGVCSHSCPSFCEPFSKHGIAMFLDDDPPLAKDIDKERETLDQVWQKLRQDGHPLRSWFYGHYHYHYRAEHEGVCFTMLDMAREGRYDMVEISTGI